MARNSWPAAAIVITAMVCVTVLAVFHAASNDLLALVTAAVVPTVTMLLVGGQISGQVSEVKTQVNGRMSELIAQRERAVTAAQLAGGGPQEIFPAGGPPAGAAVENSPVEGASK